MWALLCARRIAAFQAASSAGLTEMSAAFDFLPVR